MVKSTTKQLETFEKRFLKGFNGKYCTQIDTLHHGFVYELCMKIDIRFSRYQIANTNFD
jgi:hypothetical protein